MSTVRWGIVGCGDVTEVKSGPGFQQAHGSSLVAVMRRDRAKAEDYARRHGVPRAYDDADALIADPDVDAVYIATPPSSHAGLALRVAAAKKPCLVEKPMARTHAECTQMVEAFRHAGVPLWVAYYRRALPRFLELRRMVNDGAVGRVTSVHVEVTDRLAIGADAAKWRFDPDAAGAGLFFDLASHCVDLLDFILGPITVVHGVAMNTGGAYAAEDLTSAVFRFGDRATGTGVWNFNAGAKTDLLTFTGSDGTIVSPVFSDTDLVVTRSGVPAIIEAHNPPHVHQPLIQSIVDELHGRGQCESTGASGARASWVMDQCVAGYYRRRGALPV